MALNKTPSMKKASDEKVRKGFYILNETFDNLETIQGDEGFKCPANVIDALVAAHMEQEYEEASDDG